MIKFFNIIHLYIVTVKLQMYLNKKIDYYSNFRTWCGLENTRAH